jgi:hypothetical protein
VPDREAIWRRSDQPFPLVNLKLHGAGVGRLGVDFKIALQLVDRLVGILQLAENQPAVGNARRLLIF